MLQTIKTILKGSLIYSLGNISSKLIGLILMPIFVANLTISEYGTLGILEVTVQILISTFGLGIWYALERWYWDKNNIDKQKSIYFTVIVFSSLIAIILFFVVFSVSSSLSFLLFDNAKYSYVLILMAIIAGLEIIAMNPATLLRLKNRSTLFLFSITLKLVLMLGFTLYFLLIKGKKIEGIYEAQLIAEVVYFLFLLGSSVKDIEFKFDLRTLTEMINYRLPLVFSSVFIVLLSFTDRYVLKFLGSLSDVGVYSMGFKLANTIKVIIVSSVWFALSPMIYKMMDKPDNKRFYSKVMTYFTFGVLIFVIAISVFGKEIVYLVASKPEYREAFKIIPIISFAIVFGMLKDVALTGLNITKRTRIIAILIIIISILNLGLNILFVPYYNSIGAASATLISQLMFFILVLGFSQKVYNIPYELKKIGVLIITGIFLVIVGNLFNQLYLPARLVLKLLIVVSFPFLLYFLKFFEQVEIQGIKAAWLKWRNPFFWKKNIKELMALDDKN